MKNRIFTLVSAVILLLTVIPVSVDAVEVGDFTDVKASDWYYDAVDYAASNGLFAGTSKTTFSPNMNMDRGMFATVLGRKANVPDTYGRNQSSPFIDLTQADYFYPFTVWSKDNGIVSGVGNGKFNPKGQITREQMATMLYNFARYAGYDTTFSDGKFYQFPDYQFVSAYAVDALKWATTHGVIGGMGGKLAPQNKATRAQVAQVFLNFSKMEPNNTSEPDNPDENWWENYDPGYQRPTGKSATDINGGYYDYDMANEIMDLINDIREQNGLNALKYHPLMQEWASIRANEASILYSHTRPNGTSCETVGYDIHAENLAGLSRGTVSEYGASAFANGWYESSGHRHNMLNTAANIGAISCYVINGKTYAVHLFSNTPIYIFDLA